MKKLKFRAWNNEHNKMYKVHSLFLDKQGNVTGIHFIYHGGITTADVKSPYMEGIAVKVMEYTGLKDKNEKEIYEGDIVELFFDAKGIEQWKEKAVVEWRDGALLMHIIKKASNFRKGEWFEHFNAEEMGIWKCEDIEIIGNIYENPELL